MYAIRKETGIFEKCSRSRWVWCSFFFLFLFFSCFFCLWAFSLCCLDYAYCDCTLENFRASISGMLLLCWYGGTSTSWSASSSLITSLVSST